MAGKVRCWYTWLTKRETIEMGSFVIEIEENEGPLLGGVHINLDTNMYQARRICKYFTKLLPEATVTLAEYHDKSYWQMLVGKF